MSQISLEKIRKPLSRKAFTLCLHFSRKFRIQAPFSNITPDWMVPTDLSSQPCIVGGKPMDFTCGDCQAEMAFIEVMIGGRRRRPRLSVSHPHPAPFFSIIAEEPRRCRGSLTS